MAIRGLFPKGKNGKKRKVVIACLCAVALTAAAAALYLKFAASGEKQELPDANTRGGRSQFALTGDMVAASGVTTAGVTAESFDVENLAAALEIEEVYIASEDVVAAGEKVLKLSEESVAKARKELEQTLREADLAYRSGAIAYEQSKITAEYDRDSALLGGEQAQAVCQETITGLKTSVETAQEALSQAKENMAEYQSYVNNDSYKSYFKVDECQAAYDETLSALMAKMEEWGVSWAQVTGQGGGSMSGSGAFGMAKPAETVSGADAGRDLGPTSDQIQILASLYKVLEKELQALEQAKSDCEDALANAAFSLQTLELQLPQLENALAEAEKNYQSQILQAQLTCETSLAKAQSAKSDYETAMQQAETHFASLQKAWENAKENLELFEERVGDGYFHASESGTILRAMVRAGQSLASEAVVFFYSNPKETMATVSVSQADIAKIALNDRVYIQSGEYGGFEGVVAELNPISGADSRTNVTYSVTVAFVGDSVEVPANKSVTVIFGMDAAALQNMQAAPSETTAKDAVGGGRAKNQYGEGQRDAVEKNTAQAPQ